METKYNVGESVVALEKVTKNKMVECDICSGSGNITIKDFSFSCPKCKGRKEVLKPVTEIVKSFKIITSINISNTGVHYQLKGLLGNNPSSCKEEDIVGRYNSEVDNEVE